METWKFLTAHARALLCIARDPGVRLREIATSLGITERSAHAIVADLTAAGYVVKHKLGRRNRYQIQAHLPLPEPATREPAIGDVLTLLVGDAARRAPQQPPPGPQHAATSGTDHKQSPRTSPKPAGHASCRKNRAHPARPASGSYKDPRARAATTTDSTGTSDAARTARAGTLPP
jgi:hypothetical protein